MSASGDAVRTEQPPIGGPQDRALFESARQIEASRRALAELHNMANLAKADYDSRSEAYPPHLQSLLEFLARHPEAS